MDQSIEIDKIFSILVWKSADKQYYLDKLEVKKKEINSMFKDLETEYDKKIDFLVKIVQQIKQIILWIKRYSVH